MMTNIQTLSESPAGTLWCGTRQELYYLPPGKSDFIKEKFLPVSVNCLLLDKESERPWCGTDGGLWQWSGQDWQKVRELKGGVVNCLAADATGTLWAGTRKGLWRRRDQHWRQMEIPLPTAAVRCLLVSPEGLYCGTEEGLVVLDTDGSWSRLEMQNPQISCLTRSRSRLFCGTNDGLFRKKPDEQVWSRTQRPEKIKALLVDSQERLWCATEEGLFRFHDGEWSKILETPVQCLLEERNGRIQGGTTGGLIRLCQARDESKAPNRLLSKEPPAILPPTIPSVKLVTKPEDRDSPSARTPDLQQLTPQPIQPVLESPSASPRSLRSGWFPLLALAVLSGGIALFFRPQPVTEPPLISPPPIAKQLSFIQVVQQFFTAASQNGQLPYQFTTGHLQRNVGSRTERVIAPGNYAGVRNCLEQAVKGGTDVRCTLLLHKQPPLSVRVHLVSTDGGHPKVNRIQYYSTRLCSDGRKHAYTYSDTDLYRGGNPIARVPDPCLK